MFFLLPTVTVVLLAVFATLGVLRAWRQRHAPLRQRGGHPGPAQGRGQAQGQGQGRVQALVPAALLRGAERTWVVFSAGAGDGDGRRLVAVIRDGDPEAQVSEVDCAEQPELAARFGVDRLPTVLLVNRYGQVEDRAAGRRPATALARRRRYRRSPA